MRAATLQPASKPFLTLTASDLMTAPVMTIPPETSLREAARLLGRSSVSGAPVVDKDGHCLGVLSSNDFVTWAGKEGEASSFIAPWGEMINIDDSPDDEIRHYMTAQTVTVTPPTPIGELAQMMVDAHIHRVLVMVVAEKDQPLGIVTSTDILAAIADAARKATLPRVDSDSVPRRKRKKSK